MLLATDRSGVLASDDGAQTFSASNHGYAHRYVSSILADKNDPNRILVGVVNDREFGGVFSTRDGGQTWQQKSAGLGGRDVFALQQTSQRRPDRRHQQGHLPAGSQFQPVASDQHHRDREVSGACGESRKKGKKGGAKVPAVVVRSVLDARVSDIEITPKRWLAATSAGLFSSADQGKTWTGGSVMGKSDFVAVESNGELIGRRHSHQRSLFLKQWSDLAAGAAVLLHHQPFTV